jgi:hypothetical protein
MPTIPSNLVSLDQFAAQSPAINRRLLTYWVQSNLDGFRDSCVLKVGRRLLLDQAAVAVWLEAHRPAHD